MSFPRRDWSRRCSCAGRCSWPSITIALKTLAWWLTGSVGLLSDAMESLVNLASAAFALLMVSIAQRPADADHPYGHHKAEYFSAGFEGLMIMVAAAGIMWAVLRLRAPQPLEQVGLGLLSVVSSAINGGLAWVMLQSARTHRSMALEGDARHLLTDVWTSAGVVIGVGLVALTGWLWLDPVVGILVAANILREGVHLMWKSSEGLMDRALEPELIAEIEHTLEQFKHPYDPLRPSLEPLRQAPLRGPAHAHAGELDAGARGGSARFGGTGAHERGAGCAPPSSCCPATWKRISTTRRT